MLRATRVGAVGPTRLRIGRLSISRCDEGPDAHANRGWLAPPPVAQRLVKPAMPAGIRANRYRCGGGGDRSAPTGGRSQERRTPRVRTDPVRLEAARTRPERFVPRGARGSPPRAHLFSSRKYATPRTVPWPRRPGRRGDRRPDRRSDRPIRLWLKVYGCNLRSPDSKYAAHHQGLRRRSDSVREIWGAGARRRRAPRVRVTSSGSCWPR